MRRKMLPRRQSICFVNRPGLGIESRFWGKDHDDAFVRQQSLHLFTRIRLGSQAV
jgi:hypothetical protein